MKLACAVFTLQLLFMTAFSQPITGDAWNTVKSTKSGTLHVIYANDFYINTSGSSPSGISFNILQHFVEYVQKKYGAKLTIAIGHRKDYFTVMTDLKKSTDSVISANLFNKTKERMNEYDMTSAVGASGTVFISNQAVKPIASKADAASQLKGLTAYTRKGSYQSIQMEDLKKNHAPDLQIQSTSALEIDIIASDPKAVAYVNAFVYLDAVKNKLPVVRHPALDGPRETFHVLLSKDSGWKDVFNEFLNEYLTGTAYKEEMIKNFGMTGYKMLALE